MVFFNELFQTVRLSKWNLHFDTSSFYFCSLKFIYNKGIAEGKEWGKIICEEASVDGVVLTPLTPFNSLTPPLIPSSYESCSLQVRSKG